MKSLYFGLSSGKYRNPFLTITLKNKTIIIEILTCNTSFLFYKFYNSKEMTALTFFKLSLTIFKRN